jgi:serine protease AprX
LPRGRPFGSADNFGPATGGDLALRYGYEGRGVTVAVIDSGIADHADLRDAATGLLRVLYHESFVPRDSGNGKNDRYGHGTHVAGIVAGNGASAPALRGMAPQAWLIDLQELDDNGVGSDSSVIAALERAIELKDRYGIRVVNLSLGRPVWESYRHDPICQAVEEIW